MSVLVSQLAHRLLGRKKMQMIKQLENKNVTIKQIILYLNQQKISNNKKGTLCIAVVIANGKSGRVLQCPIKFPPFWF